MFKAFRAHDAQALALRSNGFDYDWEIIASWPSGTDYDIFAIVQ